jgi:hypothetical protein
VKDNLTQRLHPESFRPSLRPLDSRICTSLLSLTAIVFLAGREENERSSKSEENRIQDVKIIY